MTIDDATLGQAEEEAARRGETLSWFVEKAVRERLAACANEIKGSSSRSDATPLVPEHPEGEIDWALKAEMDELRERTSHFKIGTMPTRDEMNER